MKLVRYKDFRINESNVRTTEDYSFPCYIDSEPIESYPCVKMNRDENVSKILCYDRMGNCVLDFSIPNTCYSIVTDNPGPEQMVSIDKWSKWMREQSNSDNINDLVEFIEFSDDDDSMDVLDELSFFLDVIGLNDKPASIKKQISKDLFLIGLENDMESEVEYSDDLGSIKRISIFLSSDDKYPSISLILTPKVRWEFLHDGEIISISDVSGISDRRNLIGALINSCLGKAQDTDEIEIIKSYYLEKLDDLKTSMKGEGHRKNMDVKDQELFKFKNLVSKFIGDKTADELYRQAKSEISNNR
jgi:hypothetical protein